MRVPLIAMFAVAAASGMVACKPADKPGPQAASTTAKPRAAKQKAAIAKPAPAAATSSPATDTDESLRFDMTQDGKQMSADQFDSWLDKRGVTVASGAPAGEADQAQPSTPAAAVGRD